MLGVEVVARADNKVLQVRSVVGQVKLRIENYTKDNNHIEDFVMDRKAINDLIVKLREARDHSYGKDQ